MLNPHSLHFVQIIISLFIGVLFTQSGLDKIIDFNGNKGYINSVFEKTFLKNVSTLLLVVVTLLEVSAGMLCLIGSWFIFYSCDTSIATLGAGISSLALLSLFTGQRIAKDYAGAASLLSYFILSIIGVLIISLGYC
jgi:putative oxidoreductase